MRLLVLGMAVVMLGPAVQPANAVSRRQCLQACAARIQACATTCGTFGDMEASCKKQVVKRCKHDGVASCSTASGSTTTTIAGGATTTIAGGAVTTSTIATGGMVTLTLKNYLAWCSVTVNNGTASTASEQTLMFPPNAVVALSGDKASAAFVWGYWVGTAGDTGPSHDTAMATMVTMDTDKTVQACCPIASMPEPCPAP